MYILKNAWTNIKRSIGRNILIGIIIMVITASSCVALAINTSGNKLIQSYTDKNELEVTFKLNMDQFRQNSSENSETKIDKLTVDDIKNYANSDYVSSYYYTLETSLSSDSIEAIDMSEIFQKPDNEANTTGGEQNSNRLEGKMGSQGDFKLTAYSDVSYIESFTEGTSKITSGTMITNDNENNDVVISEDLANENNLKVGDTINLYLPSDSTKTYEFKIVGIFQTETDTTESNFMNMKALNSQNQIYTTVTAVNTVLNDSDNGNKR